jgi:menaquinone-dependent protoporphyrinogen oxidase
MTAQTSRRQFLKTSCLAAAAVGVTVCGGGAIIANIKPKIDLPQTKSTSTENKKRVLIAYATKAGSTAETAARMGETLTKKGLSVDVLPVSQVKDITQYETVVVGSAIRMGSVLPEAKIFIETNRAALSQKTFGLFILCLTLSEKDDTSRQKATAFLDPIRTIVEPSSEGLFAGVMNPDKLTLLDRTIVVTMMKSPVGDFRDWDEINSWIEKLA